MRDFTSSRFKALRWYYSTIDSSLKEMSDREFDEWLTIQNQKEGKQRKESRRHAPDDEWQKRHLEANQ